MELQTWADKTPIQQCYTKCGLGPKIYISHCELCVIKPDRQKDNKGDFANLANSNVIAYLPTQTGVRELC